MVRPGKEGNLTPDQRGQTRLAVNRGAVPAESGLGGVSVRPAPDPGSAFTRTQGGRHADHP
jgi:hypothetical protein